MHGRLVRERVARLEDPDRTIRKAAAEGCTRGLQENARLLTYIFNTLVFDHQTDCTLRKYPSPDAPRHLANEITQSVVDALMTATERYHATVQRYYRLKTRLLGVGQLYDYDRYAPIFQEETKCPWPKGRETLNVTFSGRGAPWAIVQSRAAIPLKAPLSTGYAIRRSITPVEQKDKSGFSRSDVYRVTLEIDAQTDMTWVVVDDPIPAGAAILGSGLGRDAASLTGGEKPPLVVNRVFSIPLRKAVYIIRVLKVEPGT